MLVAVATSLVVDVPGYQRRLARHHALAMLVESQDVANRVVWLASGEARFVAAGIVRVTLDSALRVGSGIEWGFARRAADFGKPFRLLGGPSPLPGWSGHFEFRHIGDRFCDTAPRVQTHRIA
jgi:hypothetical protein